MRDDPQQPIQPAIREDGTVDSIVLHQPQRVGGYTFLELAIPTHVLRDRALGKLVLARCSEASNPCQRKDWSIYLRRPLYVTGAWNVPDQPDAACLRVLLPDTSDAGYSWLRNLPVGAAVNVLGPLGRDVELPPDARHLLLVASPEGAPLLFPAIDQMLDRNGRVTLIVRDRFADQGLLSLLPLSVELQTAQERSQWLALVGDGVAWADAMLICDASLSPQTWAEIIRNRRLVFDTDYAQIWMHADYLCGTGACMACVVSRSDGSLTRACVHGPFFPLTSLIR